MCVFSLDLRCLRCCTCLINVFRCVCVCVYLVFAGSPRRTSESKKQFEQRLQREKKAREERIRRKQEAKEVRVQSLWMHV